MSLTQLSREMGGSPGASFLSRVESGEVSPSPRVAVRLADALGFPRDLVLNASGFATPAQVNEATEKLAELVGAPTQIVASVPVLDPADPDAPLDFLARRQRMVKKAEDVFLVDLAGPANAPYDGEVMASRTRKPKEGAGVVAVVGGQVGAWTWHTGRPTGDWLENGRGEKVAKGFRILGVIIRVTTATEFDTD